LSTSGTFDLKLQLQTIVNMRTFTSLALFALATLVTADPIDHKKHAAEGRGFRGLWKIPGHGMEKPPIMGNATFRQLIDHKRPELGTFEQTYWYSNQFWKGPGSPVVVRYESSSRFPIRG
jgi:hypothetical protein